MSRTSLLVVVIIVLAVLLLIVAFASAGTRYWGRAPVTTGSSSSFPPYVPGPSPVYPPPQPTTQPPQPTAPNSIIYGMSQDPSAVSAARADCTSREGRFNECASPCGPNEMCAQVCVLACEF